MTSQNLTIKRDEILPFEIGYLPRFSIKKCEIELNETPERKSKAVQELRSLLEKNQATSGIDFQEDFLVAYLRRNKYRLKDAHRQIQNSILLNETERDVLKGVPDECLDLPSSKYLILLPKRCPEGCALLVFRWAKWESTDLTYHQLWQVLAMIMSQALRDPMTQIHGFKVIQDWKGVTWKILRHMKLHTLHQFYNITVNCFPARWKEIHMINQSSVMKIVWSTIKPFLTEKIRNRVYFHNSSDELFEYFSRCILPTQYGGYIQETDMNDWIRRSNKEQQRFTLQGQPNSY